MIVVLPGALGDDIAVFCTLFHFGTAGSYCAIPMSSWKRRSFPAGSISLGQSLSLG